MKAHTAWRSFNISSAFSLCSAGYQSRHDPHSMSGLMPTDNSTLCLFPGLVALVSLNSKMILLLRFFHNWILFDKGNTNRRTRSAGRPPEQPTCPQSRQTPMPVIRFGGGKRSVRTRRPRKIPSRPLSQAPGRQFQVRRHRLKQRSKPLTEPWRRYLEVAALQTVAT